MSRNLMFTPPKRTIHRLLLIAAVRLLIDRTWRSACPLLGSTHSRTIDAQRLQLQNLPRFAIVRIVDAVDAQLSEHSLTNRARLRVGRTPITTEASHVDIPILGIWMLQRRRYLRMGSTKKARVATGRMGLRIRVRGHEDRLANDQRSSKAMPLGFLCLGRRLTELVLETPS